MGYVRVRGGVRAIGPISLPAGYTKLEYIKSTGTQYIDTGVYPTQDTEIDLRVSVENGNFYAAVNGGNRFGLYVISNATRIDYSFGASGYVGNVLSGLDFPADIVMKNGLIVANQDDYTFSVQSAFSIGYTLPLFGENASGSVTASYGILYRCEIREGGTKIREFIPCKNAEGVPGLWDLVNKQFYPSASSTSFIEPPPKGLPAIGTALNDMSWEEVRAISDAGLAADYFAVGDRKGVTLNGTVGSLTFSNETYYAYIIGIDHNADIEGANKIHFQFGYSAESKGVHLAFVDSGYGNIRTDGSWFKMNNTATNSGGWSSSYMRTIICPAFKSAMPSDLQTILRATTKYSDNTGGGSDTASYVTATSEEVFLLAEFEVFGTRSYANSAEQNYQEQYVWYSAGNSKVRYRHSEKSSEARWWLRSVYVDNSSHFCRLDDSGSAYYNYAYYSYGFAPAFAVGGSTESGGESTRMITFTITDAFTSNAVEHQAKAGMTWGEWVQSEYNTDGHTVDSDNSITGADGYYFVMLGSAYVYASDTIQENGAYRAT